MRASRTHHHNCVHVCPILYHVIHPRKQYILSDKYVHCLSTKMHRIFFYGRNISTGIYAKMAATLYLSDVLQMFYNLNLKICEIIVGALSSNVTVGKDNQNRSFLSTSCFVFDTSNFQSYLLFIINNTESCGNSIGGGEGRRWRWQEKKEDEAEANDQKEEKEDYYVWNHTGPASSTDKGSKWDSQTENESKKWRTYRGRDRQWNQVWFDINYFAAF